MRQRTQTFALHCAPLSFQRVTLTTRGRTVHQQLCLLQCLLFCLFCLIHFIIFLHPLSKHLLRPQHMNLCLGKHSTFLSCNTICVASSHFCVFDHCFEKKKRKSCISHRTHLSCSLKWWNVALYKPAFSWEEVLGVDDSAKKWDFVGVYIKYAHLVN